MPLMIRIRFVCLLFVLALCAAASAANTVTKPNILLILADDVGREVLGCYGGSSYKTPNIDQLAKQGTRFDHCYVMSVCHPTRVALLTGRYPFRLGGPKWGSFPIAEQSNTFAQVMKRAGYSTAVAGKWQLALLKKNTKHPNELGFDEYSLFGWHEGPRYWQPLIWQNGEIRDDTKDAYGPEIYTDFLIDFMKRAHENSKPFLAFYSMALAHDVSDDFKPHPPFGPKMDRYETYTEMIHHMDRMVGRLVAALDQMKLRQKTVIIFLTDNGTAAASYTYVKNGKMTRPPVYSQWGDRKVRGGKGSLSDLGTRVPLVVNWPGTTPAGKVVNDLVDVTDFLPTLAQLGGGQLPNGVALDGRSFAPLIRGNKQTDPRLYVFAEHRGKSFIRTHRWKLYDRGALFDMQADPFEKAPKGPAEAIEARTQLEMLFKDLRAGNGASNTLRRKQ